MRPLQTYSVTPRLPEKLGSLWTLAYNYLFSWSHTIRSIFTQIDEDLWSKSEENPVWFLNNVSQTTLEALAEDKFFLDRLEEARQKVDSYLSARESFVDFEGASQDEPAVAYFSAEFGVARCLPIYSGGLGILAGDHLKSASDLNIPLVGIGLCYQQGYFRQYLTQEGWQQERCPVNNFMEMPLTLVRDSEGIPLGISVTLEGRELRAQIWQANVGRIRLYLLDTNIEENPSDFREITAQLYGGDLEMRLKQEILLGIGGVRALRVLGLNPKVIHMNEGHSAFAGLERIRILMKENGLSFEATMEFVASSSVFTTHTPVPAGNDRFPQHIIQRYLASYAQELGLAFKVFMALGRENPHDESEQYCMTVLALRLSRFSNGVSKLHGKVSRNMWKNVWPQYPQQDIPIHAITNGIHIPTWISHDLAYLFDRYTGRAWREGVVSPRVWKRFETIPETEIWRTHERLRGKLISFVRSRLKKQTLARGGRYDEMQLANEVLNPEILTIGFARRFATYKRAYLLLRDKDRLLKLIENENRPVQFIFAGKAHPQDQGGKKIIQSIIALCNDVKFQHRIVFVEDYDIEVARYMVQGCDVWLNNPRRPLEACGTSGMKAMANGGLNLSTLDGWWDEAYAPDSRYGWAIGKGEEYDDLTYQDFVESQILYNVLENDVVPAFYERGVDNIPRTWVRKMKNELCDLAPIFHSNRMVEDYVNEAYLPAYMNFFRLEKDDFTPVKELAAWRMNLMTKWGEIKIRDVKGDVHEREAGIYVGQPVEVEAQVYMADLRPQDLQVEIYAGHIESEGEFVNRKTVRMETKNTTEDGWYVYKGTVEPSQSGKFGFTIRILPRHELLHNPHCLGLIHWAE